MSDVPIIFSGDAPCKILRGQKTATRRIVKAPSYTKLYGRTCQWERAWLDPGGTIFGPGPYLKLPYGGGDYTEPDDVTCRVFCPYGYPEFKEKLYLKETWRPTDHTLCDPPTAYKIEGKCEGVTASGEDDQCKWWVHPPEDELQKWKEKFKPSATYGCDMKWRSSLFMPKWATRCWIELVTVRLEKLTQMTEADAVAEGYASLHEFKEAWVKMHKTGLDLWVWAVTFRVCEK